MTHETPLAPHPTLSDYYGDDARRERFVRDIFDETAPWYDWIVSFSSFGSGDRYRREQLQRIGVTAETRLLDVATGTGVVARAARELTRQTRNIVGVDVSIGMLQNARTNVGIAAVQAGSERLPFQNESFDAISVGFAMRHFADLHAVFAEYRRVLRPGGRVLIMEITAPDSAVGRALLGAYMGGIVPLVARVRSRSANVQKVLEYYWDTTRTCVRPAVILDALRDSGFRDVARQKQLGIFSAYTAAKP